MNTPQPISVDDAVAFLNHLLELDPSAVVAIFKHRVRCNEALAGHPTVQVRAGSLKGDADPRTGSEKLAIDEYDVSILGVLNGLFGIDERGWGFIAAEYEDDGSISRFVRTPHNPKERRT
jgi:hypothetical protein